MTETCSCPPEAGTVNCDLRDGVSACFCPKCLRKGKPVDSVTLKALLNVPLTEVRPVAYRFCSTQNCPVVYYSHDGTQTFLEIHVRERVFQKHMTDNDVFVCYCFRYTVGRIKGEKIINQSDSILAMIDAAIQAGQCACDIRNPQGSCCLGNVREFVKNLEVDQG